MVAPDKRRNGRRRCYLPSTLCHREGVTEDDVFAGNSTAGMRNVALEVAATAKVSPERSLRHGLHLFDHRESRRCTQHMCGWCQVGRPSPALVNENRRYIRRIARQRARLADAFSA